MLLTRVGLLRKWSVSVSANHYNWLLEAASRPMSYRPLRLLIENHTAVETKQEQHTPQRISEKDFAYSTYEY